ncbi:MAG: cyclodeaminase/cyclohydrolase family protein [Endomicrobia bacterium]|nr:cyclodeaminase/cyclohydrolase family protein [Endomicrobiia bacterium]
MIEPTSSYLLSTIKKYLEDLSSNLPAPGGGSASALVASCGISCLLMVANFTVGKKGYEQYQDEIKKIIAELEHLLQELQKFIDKDVEAYNKVSSAYKLPKTTPLDEELRQKQIQIALKEAADTAFETMKLAHSCMPVAERLIKIGNKNLITDIACGVIFLQAGVLAAKYNVFVNLKFIKEHQYTSEIKKKVRKIITDTKIISKKVLQKIQI